QMAVGVRFRLDRELAAARQDEQAAFRARLLEGRPQQRLDHPLEDDLARHGFGHLNHRREVELFYRRADGGRQPGGRRLLAEVRVSAVELPDLAVGAPAKIRVARIAKTGVRDALQTAVGVEARGELVRERLVVDEAVALRRAKGLLVAVHRLERAPTEPGDL